MLWRLDMENIIMTTGHALDGYSISDYLGIVHGEIAVPNELMGAFTTGTFFTIDSMATARQRAIDSLVAQACERQRYTDICKRNCCQNM